MSNAKKPLILCVDDEPAVLQVEREMLKGGGYDVITADSGGGALATLQQAKPDLMLLDIRMPEMDGYQVYARMQEDKRMAHIPVIFVTGLDGEEEKARALTLGGAAYVVKPFSVKTLLPVVQAHIDALPGWKGLRKESHAWDGKIQPDFFRFKEYLCDHLNLLPDRKAMLAKFLPGQLYTAASEMGIATSIVAKAIAEVLNLAYVPSINAETIRPGVLQPPFCKTHHVIPTREESGAPAFVLSNPFNWDLLDALKRLSKGQPASLIITEPENIDTLLKSGAALRLVATDTAMDFDLLTSEAPEGEAEGDIEDEYEVLNPIQLAHIGKQPPIIRLVNMILTNAVKAGASDIHIEPQEKLLLVRYRVDGILNDALKIPKHLQPNTLSRLKIIAGMDIGEHRRPQDGRSRLRVEDKQIDLRVSILPTQFGEKVVIRLLDSGIGLLDIGGLGLTSDNLQSFQRLLSQPLGMILITGPTGSGKTTTLYSALNWLKSPTKNIITLEDPIEFRIPGLNQVQINTKTGMTFAAGLRSVVRQDPNIVLVGEIRDQETATVASEAAQTGQLLLSTLHTNDAVSTITRMLDLGLESFEVAASVIGVLSQRLARRVCPACAVSRAPLPEVVEKVGGSGRLPASPSWKAGAGCAACQHSGYKGRLAIHELLEVTEPLRELISARAADHVIRNAARRAGMRTMMEDGITKAAQGLTTLEEVVRVAPRDDGPAAPMDDSQPLENLVCETSPKTVSKGKTSILILEDDVDTQMLIVRILEKGGYETTVAGDGIEALLHLGKTDFDLILSDITMPNLDGIKLLEMNNQKGITTPVIFLTATTEAETEQKCLELGAVDYIKKPIQKDILLMRVKRACLRPAVTG
ncbi:MAG: Flp pilus assembly complex ATPase component TadA [Nitrospiraceae bacterium]|nr:Flp pilus assembly complex ATPase component TadA [Nitrospiraceae bacterium]